MRYRSVIADSARWDGFDFRPGDIVISTPPKCGTTWTRCSARCSSSTAPVERFRLFVTDDTVGGRPNLASVLHHLDTGWQRRHDRNVTLFHYADYKTDLEGEVLRLAQALDIPCSPERARALVPEASLARMRERASELAPEASFGNWKNVQGFFRSGGTGEWRERLTPGDLAAYDVRVAGLVEAPVAAWAHRGRLASGVDPAR